MTKKGWLKKKSFYEGGVDLKRRVFMKKKGWLKEKRFVWRRRPDLKKRGLYEEGRADLKRRGAYEEEGLT